MPSEIYSKLLAQATSLNKTPTQLITHVLKDELGLVGLPLEDDEIFGDNKIANEKTESKELDHVQSWP